jgi:Ca2+-binding EF-hand superfamily protein
MTAACLDPDVNNCPTEQDWCTRGHDPKCSLTPYHEPSATLTPRAIAGFTAVAAVVSLVLLFIYHMVRLKNQQVRYKKLFARRVMENVQIRHSIQQLNYEALAEEFKRMDRDITGKEDGFISKSELWVFFSSEKAGEISESDFNALFAAMDLNNSGKVNFTEFCGFLSTCGAEIDELIAERPLSGTETLDRAARRISSVGFTTSIGENASLMMIDMKTE